MISTAVHKELYDAEENGGQHIFYFRITANAGATSDQFQGAIVGDSVATRLWGKGWKDDVGTPVFYLKPTGHVWSVFRITTDANGKAGWVAKMYGGLPRKKLIRKRMRGDKLFKVWRVYTSREVYLAKYHPFGILEIRVPITKGRAELLESKEEFLQLIRKGLASKWLSVDEWDLGKALSKLKDQAASNRKIYRLGTVRVRDGQLGITTVSPPSSDEDVTSDPARLKTLALFKDCNYLVIKWLKTSTLDEELRTVIGRIRSNEVLITAKAHAEAVNYVTYRLREFSA